MVPVPVSLKEGGVSPSPIVFMRLIGYDCIMAAGKDQIARNSDAKMNIFLRHQEMQST